MKGAIVLLVASLAVAAQASYLPTAWPLSVGWNSWNGLGGLNAWDNHGIAAYPYAKSWSAGWPVASQWNNGWNGYYGGVDKLNSWGLPWAGYGAGAYGWGHHGLAKTVVPVAKQIASTPGSLHVAPVPIGGEKVVGLY
ncbi:uncharacterized protein LOC129780564 [Toxorhynchites rutilus septentrionalis]|uniref:uncharacterized protein LOC129780561 n=1 Tax=Toxorhynchites rutilus septentrionalis TaxID=329112 RepID=UPI0024783F49|nr:uncharacterized protein LOC129780561 [Toxorhynchites rutilus septentrionalis]XP_055644922.1 uncharacterized protein LOC129780564 [Toxorhynchites rutilus septentrionalis]